MLRGYSAPRSPEGRSSLVPGPPWHYVGTMLVVEYWAGPAAAAAVLPPPLEPHPDDGRAAAMFIDWQSCTDGGEQLLDPSRSQYKEFFVTVNALYRGEEVAYCPYIWVDRDFALARGWIQGFPKKLGSIWITRSFGLETKADPGVGPGSAYGGTCAGYERRLAEATVTLERRSDAGPTHNDPPIVNVRHFPRLGREDHDAPAVHELVRSRAQDRSASEIWEGTATLELLDAPGEELAALAPARIGKGFRFTIGYSVDDLETLEEL
jgi:acetoacetate decarboxylase